MKRHFFSSRLALVIALWTSEGLAQSLVMFDADILRARGIPDSVSAYFQAASLFPPGLNHPNLVVNGKPRGIVPVIFNNDGVLCADKNFLKAAGILTTQIDMSEKSQKSGCYSLPAGIEVKLQPGRQCIEILAPQRLIDGHDTKTVYVSGGHAAILNYNLHAAGNRSRNNSSYIFYGHTESGLNSDNWIVRSYDSFFDLYNKTEFQHHGAWIQRTFPAIKSTLQAGQLMLNSPLFSSPMFNGIQARQEGELIKTDNAMRVTGVANSAARIDVRQGNTLIYSTLVPAGLFVLDNLVLNNTSQDLEVSVIENDGGNRRFTVPAASFISSFIPVQQGWTIAAGKPRETGPGDKGFKSHGFVTATATFPVNKLYTNVTAGLMAAQRYMSLGFHAETRLWKGASTYLRCLVANDARASTHGAIMQTGHSMALGNALSVILSSTFYTPGFRYLTDIPQSNQSQNNRQKRMYSASLRWKNEKQGDLDLGFTHSEWFDNTSDNYPNISWSRNFGPANVSLSISPRSGQYDDDMYYFQISLPLGKTNTSFFSSKEGRYIYKSAIARQQLNNSVGYSIGTSTLDNRLYGFNGSIALQTRYAHLYSNYNYNGYDSHSWSGSMNGSVINDSHGMLFSQYSISDTFGVVSVSGLPNARIQTPSGLVWTNDCGRAVVPSITPYIRSRVELITQGLPRNINVRNVCSIIEAWRGSVTHVNLKAERHRKILLRVRRPDGKLFSHGMPVLDSTGHYLSITGADSDVYLDAEHTSKGLRIEDESGQRCTLDFKLNQEAQKVKGPYETISAICR